MAPTHSHDLPSLHITESSRERGSKGFLILRTRMNVGLGLRLLDFDASHPSIIIDGYLQYRSTHCIALYRQKYG